MNGNFSIIRQNLVYDPSLMNDWGGFAQMILNAYDATEKEYDRYTTEDALREAERQLVTDTNKALANHPRG